MNILMNSSFDNFLQLIWVLLIFVFVLLITYLTTRWIGGYQKTHLGNRTLNVIGNNKSVCILQAGSKYLVVAVGKDEMHLLAELTEEEMKDVSFVQNTGIIKQESFQEIFSKLKDKYPKKQG